MLTLSDFACTHSLLFTLALGLSAGCTVDVDAAALDAGADAAGAVDTAPSADATSEDAQDAPDAAPPLEDTAGADVSGLPLRCPAGPPLATSPGLAITLTWETPGDPDETDAGPESGSDLDLHLLHQAADRGYDVDGDGEPDGWFDNRYDCFWYNERPNWGSDDPSVGDDPELTSDATNACGPEVVVLDLPEDGTSYRVGVHAWDDHGYGASFARLRVVVRGELVFDRTLELVDRDLWFAARISWPSGDVTRVRGCGGTPTPCEADGDCADGSACVDRVAPGYVHPLFVPDP